MKDRQVDAGKVLYKAPTLPKEVEEYKPPVNYEELVGDMNLPKLHEIFKSIIKKQEEKIDPIRSTFGKIEKENVDMDAKMIYVEDYIKQIKNCSFRDLLENQKSKMETVVTFMVILELMKSGKITIIQEAIFDDIYITYREESEGDRSGREEAERKE